MLTFYKDTRNTKLSKCINNAQPEPEPCYKKHSSGAGAMLQKTQLRSRSHAYEKSSGDGAGANSFLQELSSPDRKEFFPSKEWDTEQSVYFAS